MKEVIRSADPRIAALIARQAAQARDRDGLGLERIAALLEALGRPQDRLPPVFHVAGTNGKGSTLAFLRAALEAAGHRVHAFTSPHLVRYNERIRLAGALIDDARLARLMGEVLDANEAIGGSLFEVNTAVAFLAFAEVEADALLLEVGLGGRLDATNIVERPLVTGIADLGLDHAEFLGDTLASVAREKAGIAKRGVPLVTMAYPPEASAAIARAAAATGADWRAMGDAWDARPADHCLHVRDARGSVALPLPRLRGGHQWRNAALAVAMLRAQDALAVPDAALAQAMDRADWPARMQWLAHGPLADALPPGSELWVDGAHNVSAAQSVAAHLAAEWEFERPLVLVFASLKSKDSEGVLSPFVRFDPLVIALPIPGHDSRDPAELAAIAERLGLDAEVAGDLDAALARVTAPSRVLVLGSLYLAGVVLEANGSLPD